MNQLNTFITNEKLQLLMMIPVFLGAFYVAMRISCAGVGVPNMFRSRPRLVACIVLTVLGTGCLAYIFLSHLGFQIENASKNRIIVWISGFYIAFFVYFLLILTATDVIRIILRHKDKERRKMTARLYIPISVGAAVLLTVIGVIHARSIRTIYYDLSSEGQLSAPLRIVEVSDLHMGSVIDTTHVQRVVDAVNACHPDLVVFLGDQFNRNEAEDIVDAEDMFETLSHIESKIGVYAVLGNHDPELDSEIYQKFLSESGITALDNGMLEIIPGSEMQKTEIHTLISASPEGSETAAVPEIPADSAVLLAGRTKLAKDAERVPLPKLLDEAGVMTGSDHYLLVLDHDPEGIAEAVSCDADLVLAGHTHRGQFFPASLIAKFLYAKGYSYGITQTPNESTGHVTTSIVSSGAGYFQTPIRIGTDSEIVCIDLSL